MTEFSSDNKSLGGNLWKVTPVDERLVELLVQKYNFSYVLARIIALRGIADNEVLAFLEPKLLTLKEAL